MKAAVNRNPAATEGISLSGLFSSLSGSQKTKGDKPRKIRRRDLTFILSNLSTLVDNGVSLSKALDTLAKEKSLQKHSPILKALRRKLESGQSFSAALSDFPETFNDLVINQIRVAERSGTLPQTLLTITAQQEKMNELRSLIIKKLAYPALLAVMGTGVVAFMLICVVPVFEETYADAKIELPLITKFMIACGRYAASYYWILLLGLIGGVLLLKQLRSREQIAYKMDEALLKLPLFGKWFRDLAVLQLMDVLGNLMDAGFLIADALGVAADSVSNRKVEKSVKALQAAVQRGERFSKEMENHSDLFPPVVTQLVIIGEQTGNLPSATTHIRQHLRKDIERTTNVMVGTIEPVLTISLASAITVILLAIYLPMFDMIQTVGT